MKTDMAEKHAVAALGWMADDAEIMGQFLGYTGLAVDDLAKAAAQPDFLLGVIDFIMQRDDWVLDAATRLNIAPEDFVKIRAGLPGGEEMHWT